IVKGDTAGEPNETINVTLSNPKNATILDGSGVGTIVDNDPPDMSISNASVTEGDTGSKTMTFTVSLSKPPTATVKAKFATADGTATQPADYLKKSATVSIGKGKTSATIKVTIKGDKVAEADEVFVVNLSTPTGVTIVDPLGVGTIVDND
ncbi:MAG: Calx-beta domain-containing protein, partial [Actinomycetota bacterium]|nr:Calx-beta domain-containing protein [Actinomycetota bacterium]